MISQKTLDKWERILKEKYGQKNLTKQEIFEFTNTLTNFFDLLSKFDQKNQLKK